MHNCVYLLHFDQPLGNNVHHAQHYIGWAADLAARMAQHRNGTGAAITRAAIERGIAFDVVRVWPDRDRSFERALKRQKRGPKLCPICGGPHAWRRSCPSVDACQLPLDFDIPPWEHPEFTYPLYPDAYELMMERRWRAAGAALWFATLQLEDCDL